jgi:hypothetical protein
MNRYIVKRGLVRGYDIGLKNDSMYFPVADRDVISFKKYKGQIEAMLVDGTKITINDWNDRIIEETFTDKMGRGEYKIGYFLFKSQTEEDKLKELSEQSL